MISFSILICSAQRSALAAVGGSVDSPSKREKPKAGKMLIKRAAYPKPALSLPKGQLHLVMMAYHHFPRQNASLSIQRILKICQFFEKKTHFGQFLGAVLRTLCWAAFFKNNCESSITFP
jgi:hypothetical protein